MNRILSGLVIHLPAYTILSAQKEGRAVSLDVRALLGTFEGAPMGGLPGILVCWLAGPQKEVPITLKGVFISVVNLGGNLKRSRSPTDSSRRSP